MFKHINAKRVGLIFGPAAFMLVWVVVLFAQGEIGEESPYSPLRFPFANIVDRLQIRSTQSFKLERFSSEKDFKDYLQESTIAYAGSIGVRSFGIGAMEDTAIGLAPTPFRSNEGTAQVTPRAERVSSTNVQVAGVDEPDIVKTDGKQVYVSTPQYRYLTPDVISPGMPRMLPEIAPPPQVSGGVKSVRAFPPTDLKLDATIDASGDLLLADNMLVSLDWQQLVGYNVTDPTKPEKAWTVEFKNNTQFVQARLYQNQLYVVTRTGVAPARPCPLEPIILKGSAITIPCTEIYHPSLPVPTDTTYTVFALKPANGEKVSTISFTGSTDSTVVYMSGSALYVTYSYPGDILAYFVGFARANSDLFPSWFVERLSRVQGYDLSQAAKMAEFQELMQQFEATLQNDDRLKLENEIGNRMNTYSKAHKRELETTGLVKVRVPELSLAATGSVPGRPLNQFSLDEHEGNLRIATTVGGGWWGSFVSPAESASDVYVLDGGLRVLGSVTELGVTERIYAVRFMGERGYLVTFRQTDPFYVLDFANPRAPKLAGELKIPGFSSYLHPLTENRILGVGQEGGQVKLSLFDVSRASEPREVAKYLLQDYWSEVQTTHHAFLQDAEHNIFFMPGGQGGYVFEYRGDEFKLIKAVGDIRARRALYLNDYLYVVGDERIVVLSEDTWERVAELAF